MGEHCQLPSSMERELGEPRNGLGWRGPSKLCSSLPPALLLSVSYPKDCPDSHSRNWKEQTILFLCCLYFSSSPWCCLGAASHESWNSCGGCCLCLCQVNHSCSCSRGAAASSFVLPVEGGAGGMPGDLRLLWERGLACRTFLGAVTNLLCRNLGGGVDAAPALPWLGRFIAPPCLHNHLEFSPGTRSGMLTPRCWL